MAALHTGQLSDLNTEKRVNVAHGGWDLRSLKYEGNLVRETDLSSQARRQTEWQAWPGKQGGIISWGE